jgi:hypothetical protein
VIAPRGAVGPLVYLADLVGTFVIAIEGAMVATRGQRDLFGMLVLAFATAVGSVVSSAPCGLLRRQWRCGPISIPRR